MVSLYDQTKHFTGKMPRGKPISNEIRKIIIEHHKSGDSLQEIADKVKVSRYSVHNIVKLYKQTNSICPKKKTGRNSTVTTSDIVSLKRILVTNRRGTVTEIAKLWSETCKRSISVGLTHKTMKKIGFGYYKVRKLFPIY